MLSVSQLRIVDDHIFLNGRPPLPEYLNFVTSLTVDGADADQAALAQAWRAANDHVKQLESSEPGIADVASVDPLPEALLELPVSCPVVRTGTVHARRRRRSFAPASDYSHGSCFRPHAHCLGVARGNPAPRPARRPHQ